MTPTLRTIAAAFILLAVVGLAIAIWIACTPIDVDEIDPNQDSSRGAP